MRNTHKKYLNQALIYLIAVVIVIYVLAPYIWLIISSISTQKDLTEVPLRWIPQHPTLKNYSNIFMGSTNNTTDAANNFKHAFFNSAVVTISVTFLSLIVGLIAAYAYARMDFRGKKQSFYLTLLTQMIPPIALIIPLYMLALKFNLINHKITLVVIYLSLVLPFVIWIMKGYLISIPLELEDSARIDGCSRMQSFVKIILPLATPGLAATTIFAFIISWNEFFYALNFTTTTNAKTLPVLITEFSSKFGADFIMTSTGGVIASLPPLLLALIFQKYIIAGLTAGSVKG